MKLLIWSVFSVLVGVGLGLAYAWGINPAAYKDTTPASLSTDNKAAYVRLAAGALAADGNVARAKARLAALGEPNSAARIAALAQQAAAAGESAQTVRALAGLASALGAGPVTPTPPASPTVTPTETQTPTPTNTPRPTVTPYLLPTHPPTLTPPGAFGFSGKRLICDANLKQPLIQVLTLGANGEPVSGVEVLVTWAGGSDHFFTGLKPELGQGYGDFAVKPDVDYTVALASNPSSAVAGLAVASCTDNEGQTYLGSWQVVFSQP
jgi:hypothetical protein